MHKILLKLSGSVAVFQRDWAADYSKSSFLFDPTEVQNITAAASSNKNGSNMLNKAVEGTEVQRYYLTNVLHRADCLSNDPLSLQIQLTNNIHYD